MRQFQRQFATEEACQRYLAACRWPDGFRCPRCGHERAYTMVKHRRWKCVACRHQVSLTAGTMLRSEEHTSELQSQSNLVCRLLLEKKKKKTKNTHRV